MGEAETLRGEVRLGPVDEVLLDVDAVVQAEPAVLLADTHGQPSRPAAPVQQPAFGGEAVLLQPSHIVARR